MAQPQDSAEWYFAGGGSSQGQDGFAYGVNKYPPHYPEEKVDELEVGRDFTAQFDSSTFATETGGDDNFSFPALKIDSNNGSAGDYSQWSQNQNPMQDFEWPGSDSNLSFHSEYEFSVRDPVDNSANIFEVDTASNWQYSDVENDSAGETKNSQSNMRNLAGDPLFNLGTGHNSTELHLTISRDNETSFNHRIEASSTIEPGIRTSHLDAGLALDSRRRRSIRRPRVPVNHTFAQPKSHPCDRCSSAFGRAGDLRRHYRVHFPDGRTFHCHLEGCNRNGQRGFYRRDKFRDHQRQAHGFGSESELVLLDGV